MNNQFLNYLSVLRGDVYKLLPMKESEMSGIDNHIDEYIDALIVNLDGATATYPILAKQRLYLWAINNIQYLKKHNVDFQQWRTIVLNSTRNIDSLYVYYGGTKDEKRRI